MKGRDMDKATLTDLPVDLLLWSCECEPVCVEADEAPQRAEQMEEEVQHVLPGAKLATIIVGGASIVGGSPGAPPHDDDLLKPQRHVEIGPTDGRLQVCISTHQHNGEQWVSNDEDVTRFFLNPRQIEDLRRYLNEPQGCELCKGRHWPGVCEE